MKHSRKAVSPSAGHPLFRPIQTHRLEAGKEKDMARYKIRESLRKKLQEVLDKAAEKEGREVTITQIPMDEELEVFAESDGYMLLSDGRYVYDVWNDEFKAEQRFAVDNVPVAVLKELFTCLHDENLQERDRKENEDARAIEKKPWQDEDDDEDIWDRIPARGHADNPEAIVIRKLCGDDSRLMAADLDALGTEPEIGYSADGKRFDHKTMRRLESIALAYTEGLSEEKREQFNMLYAAGAVQKDLAQYWGISEAAVSKRAHDHMKKLSKILTDHGYQVPTKEELKREKKAREEEKKSRKKAKKESKSAQEHYDAAAGCIADIYLADYDEDDIDITA